MANFTVNINAELTPQYTVTANKLFKEDDCLVLNQEQDIGLIKTTNTYPIYYLLTNYIDASSWKTLKIKNIVYSNTTGFYLSDTLVKIPEAGASIYDFNVTGQAVDLAINNLTLTYDTLTLIQNETITFDLAIENLASFIGDYTSVLITLKYSECVPTLPIFNITTGTLNEGSCNTNQDVTVIVPPEGSRYVVIQNTGGFGSPVISETITSDKLYNLIIDANNATGTGTHSSVTLRVYESSGSTTSLASHLIQRDHNAVVC